MPNPAHPNDAERIAGLERELHRLRAAVEELSMLNDIAVAAGAKLSVDETLTEVVERTIKALHAEQGSLLIATGEPDGRMKTLIRQDARSSLREAYHVGIEITGYVLRYSRPLLIVDLASDPRFTPSEEEILSIRTALSVPVFSQGTLVGAMLMINKTGRARFTEDDQRTLTVVASLAGQLLLTRQLQADAQRTQLELALAQAHAEQLREISEAKSRFFSNISHDVRTPLTLILAPLEDLAGQTSSPQESKRVDMIRRNALQLLRMVNQLLDASRAEAGHLQLHLSHGDAVQPFRAIVSSFELVAQQKGVHLECEAPGSAPAWFDQEILEKVVYNLVCNALKFTPAGGRVTVHLAHREPQDGDAGRLEIVVEDTGIGISSEDIGSVFLRYYQASNSRSVEEGGSGIGLSLVKEFVELHGGNVSVTSEPGRGSRFVVTLPAEGEDSPSDDSIEESKGRLLEQEHRLVDARVVESGRGTATIGSPASRSKRDALPLLLIVEDHADMRGYLRNSLMESYRVIEAQDGTQGAVLALEAGPDLIISDIVMPGLSGTELCRMLRSDVRTSHIPIILLTAKADAESKLHGLDCGADDYLTKPFSWKELTTRVANLLEMRRRLRKRFSTLVVVEPADLDIPSMDADFLRRIHEKIDENLGDENFGVDDLARGVAMSYSHLHRKLHALTGIPPAQYVRRTRLQRALGMLQRNAGTVSEIAYSVGFNSPAYFTKCFHEQFGVPPSEMKGLSAVADVSPRRSPRK
jgi:signal transduction histidine kinase/DNA-binding response OmpR family regulator